MLVDVIHRGLRDHFRHGVVAQQLPHLRVLQGGHMHVDVGLMVLVQKGFDRLHHEEVLVLSYRVQRVRVVVHGHQFVGVLDTHHFEHLSVKQRHVEHLRRGLRHLEHGLHLHDLLRHGGRVGVAHWDDIDICVVLPPGEACATVRVILILRRGVVGDDRLEERQLLLHGEVDARLDGRHVFQRALQDGQGSPHRSLRAHVRQVQVCGVSESPSFLHDFLHEGRQHLTRLLVREREQVIPQGATGHVHVAPLPRCYRGIHPLDPHTSGLEAPRQVGQRAGIHQLSDETGAGFGECPNEVDKAEGIEPEPRDVEIVHEVLARRIGLVLLDPVTAYGQHLPGALVERYDVRECDACGAGLIRMLVALEVEVRVDLQQFMAVVRSRPQPHTLRDALLDLVDCHVRVAQVHVPVEPTVLQPLHLVGCFTHDMRHPLCRAQVRGSVGHHHVLGRHVQTHLPLQLRVEVHLLERIATQPQAPQHAFMLGAVLRHGIGELVVHILLHPGSGFFLRRGLTAYDFGPHRPCSGERRHHGLGLEFHQRLSQQGVIHPTRTLPGFAALLDLEPQQLQPIDVCLYPVFAGG